MVWLRRPDTVEALALRSSMTPEAMAGVAAPTVATAAMQKPPAMSARRLTPRFLPDPLWPSW